MNTTRQQTKSLTAATRPDQSVVTQTPTPRQKQSLVRQVASRFGVEPERLMATLKDTAFKQPYSNGKPGPEVTEAQMLALLVVANEYNLNPFLKQLYAFPAKSGGIVPMVPIDGWVRIINEHPSFKSMELVYPPDGTPKQDYWVECIIERSDRTKPTIIREYFEECYRNTDPWNSHPRRMTRHKSISQCGRVAFGFSGIYDPDEGERIANAMAIDVTPTTDVRGKPATQAPRARQIAAEQPASMSPPPADAVADEQGEFQSLASEPDFTDEEEAGSRG